MNIWTYTFLALLLLSLLTQLYLGQRQRRHVTRHRDTVPPPFADRVQLQEHQKAADYTCAKSRFGSGELLFDAALLLLWTVGGGLALLDHLWQTVALGPVLHGTGVLLSFMLIGALLGLPFTLYRTFRLEQRFGFNQTTPQTYIADLGKQLLLTLAIGAPFIALVLWLMGATGPHWWVWVWAVWMGFSLLMMWAFPRFIAPLFNRFTPLERPDLVARIEALLQRCGFRTNGVFVMDGSRRSSHGNAYFSGIGNQKRIVFFDTLLKGLDDTEVEAVLAHELGHFRLRHIPKRIALTAAITLSALALLAWLREVSWFYHGLGVPNPSDHMALLLFLLTFPLATFFVQPLFSMASRKHEFEADRFAAEKSSAERLVAALVKLYRDNASTLTPDTLHSTFYDSHPPAAIRIEHLNRLQGETP